MENLFNVAENKNFKIEKKERLPDNEAQILGEIRAEFMELCRKDAIKHLNEHLTLPGFRKGMIPEDVLVKTVGEMRVLEEVAEVALAREYENIIIDSEFRPMMRPEISVTKLAPKNPLTFIIKLVLEPEVSLPDYKKLASETKVEADETKAGQAGSSNSQGEMKEKRRLKILETIVKETKLKLPKKFVEHEMNHLLHHFKEDLGKAGIKWEDYLAKAEKKEEEIRETWREHVENRAKTELILARIAEKEGAKTYLDIFELLEKESSEAK